jgi:hypothetical protein
MHSRISPTTNMTRRTRYEHPASGARVRVKADPARTFHLFVNRMEAWWPHGRTIGKNPHVAILLEQKPGGRWFERDADANETNWGKVLDWNPPRRLLLGWQVNTG